MEAREFNTDNGRLDRATAERLSKLRSMPMDTSRLDRLLQEGIPPQARRNVSLRPQWFRPLRAVAAAIAFFALLTAVLMGTSGGPALASASEMARFHNDLISGKVPVTRVDSMDAANKALAAQWAESPQMPKMPADHVMACCMRSVKNKKMACVLLKGDGQPVTMTVANASDMQLPASPIVIRNGVQYHVESVGGLNMVMTQRAGRWVCLIANMPTDRLMHLASSLQF